MKLKDLFEDNVNVGGSSSNPQFFKTYDETKAWLDRVGIKNYTIHGGTLVVDVDGNANLPNLGVKNIPVKFGIVNGWFDIGNNQELKSLIGCPDLSIDIYISLTGINNFNGLGSSRTLSAYGIKSLESFEGLPNNIDYFYIDNSCHNVKSLDHFPKIVNDKLSIGPDFKWFDTLYKHMEMCGGIDLDDNIEDYNNIMKLLYIKGVKKISSYGDGGRIVTDILNAEIQRQPDPRKRNLLKVAQELSNAGFHNLTV